MNYNGLKRFVFPFVILPLYLGAALTTVRQVYTTADGKSANGTIIIEVTRAFTSVDGKMVPVQRRIIPFKGQLSVSLEPNSGSTPESFYQVTIIVEGGPVENSIWLVPVSATPVTVTSVMVTTVPSLSLLIQPSQISSGGATVAQCMTWGGVNWAPADCAAGSGDITAVGNCSSGNCYQTATTNYVYAGPATGSAAPAAMRALVSADIPGNAANTSGTAAGLAAQYVDWNAASGGTSIANKPALLGYPGAGVPTSTGSAWGTSYTVGTGASNLIQLNASSQLPAVSAALLTGFPTLNQNTTGNAATASALGADPADCTNQFARGINASGAAQCAAVAGTDFGTQVANTMLAGPVTGVDAGPTFRALASADIPANAANTSGTAAGLAAQYTDWNAASGGASIANKPTLLGYPGTGVPTSTGSAWGTSYTVGTGASNLVQLNASSQLPAVSAALLTSFPTLNQSTSGTAAGITGKTFIGTATQIPQFSGTPAGSKCVHTDSNGNLTEASADCGSGGGSSDFIKDFTAAKCQMAVPGAGFNLPATGAPTAACVTGADTPASVGGVLQFTDDGTTVISVQDWFILPATVSTVSLSGKWRSVVANAGLNVVWQIQTKCVGDGETLDGGAWNAAQTITDANKATANQSNDFALTPVTITGCAAGERFSFYFFRDPAHASDTLAATAELISLRFTVQ